MVPALGHERRPFMLIPLDSVHRRLAEEAADKAAARVEAWELRNSLAYRRTERQDDYVADYMAALAELSVAEYLDLPWGRYELGTVDVGDDIEVRRVTHPSRGPMIRPKDYEDRRIERHVAVYVWDDTVAEILGWVPTGSAWINGRLCACERAGACCRIFHDSNSLQLNSRHLRRPDTLRGHNDKPQHDPS